MKNEANKIRELQIESNEYLELKDPKMQLYGFKEPRRKVVGYWDKENPASIRINIRNAHRFFNEDTLNSWLNHKGEDDWMYMLFHTELRRKKAMNLFLIIFSYKLESWWE